MRKINFESIDEAVEGGFDTLPAGNYVCRITGAEDVADKEYVRVLVDVAEGDKRGFFEDKYYADKPYTHNIILSYKEAALNFLKGRLHVVTDCNPGFDAEAAFNGDESGLSLFLGKAVGVCFGEEEYENKEGDVRTSVRPDHFVRIAEIRDGSAKPARHKTLDGKYLSLEEAEQDAARAKGYAQRRKENTEKHTETYDDIPFI
jgi:hypothetical protein